MSDGNLSLAMALRNLRNEAIEECAKSVDHYIGWARAQLTLDDRQSRCDTARELAEIIRTLKR